jgi:5-methyltetrahydrofolate--homocysteine methyltransferase
MGTLLQQRAASSEPCPEAINLNRPEVLEDIARAYVEAGADIVQTNTFGASSLKLSPAALADKTEQINEAAVRAVRKAVGDQAFVSGSCGPCGQILQPYGDADPDHVYHSFLRQLKALIESGVDVICVETMMDVTEAKLAVRAAKSVSATIPVMATMTFDETPRGFYTMMGVDIAQAAAQLAEAGADVIGSNCGNGIENMIRIAAEFRGHSDLPVIVQPNAGLPEMKGDTPVYSEAPDFMAEKAKGLIDHGVSIIGGCCGTTPQHIAALRKVVDSAGQTKRRPT